MSAIRAVLSSSLESTIDSIVDDLERAKEGYEAISVETLEDDELFALDAKFRDIAGKFNFYATDAQAIAAKIIDKREEV